MSKVITSPVPHFAGTVTLADPLTFPQYQAWQAAVKAAQAAIESKAASTSDVDAALRSGLVACVESWQLQHFPERVSVDNFPATPRKSSSLLIAWLVREVAALVNEADETDPK